MTTRLLPKTALATLAAVALLLPFGAPLPGSCLRTIGVAGAAPSPSCGGDLRECLRAKADMHPGWNFGVRYVTAEDVADCMEAFRSCTSGGAGRGGNAPVPPPRTTKSQPATADEARKGLPEHFGITYGDIVSDCRLSGTTLNCTSIWQKPSPGIDSWTADITGELAGQTMTGTETVQQSGQSRSDPGCGHKQTRSGPITYTFTSDGSVAMRWGPQELTTTYTGSCSSETTSTTIPGWEGNAEWSARE